jgi:hypothetical protein
MDTEPIQRLKACETIIERGQQTPFELGAALAEIQRDKLYRDGYESFESYCQERWKIAQRTAYQFIRAAKAFENLKDCSALPTHESQLRPLTSLDPKDQRAAWVKATAESPNPTADEVQAVVTSLGLDRKERRNTIFLGTSQPSPEDSLYLLGLDYQYRVTEVIETRAGTKEKREALLAYLAADLKRRTAGIKDYFER